MALIYKFGGASVKDANSVKNLGEIVSACNTDLVIVVSAMDKTTRALEALIDDYVMHKNIDEHVKTIVKFHHNIINELFENKANNTKNEFNKIVFNLFSKLDKKIKGSYDFCYDQIIAYGEIFSSFIVGKYLHYINLKTKIVDIRKIIKTDSTHRDALINWEKTQKLVSEVFKFDDYHTYLTQGFIATDDDGNITSLGLEGSDFSAAILAYCLNAEKLVVWKDVDGIYSSDPRKVKDVVRLNVLSYREAVELAYYGAKIIHPKTIKPLENKKIPLHVKSFINPQSTGTLICKTTDNQKGVDPYVPVFITKESQILISISPRDFSFITESALEQIFSVLANNKVKVNLMQNSAISFSICVDYKSKRILKAIKELRLKYKVLYNESLSLITIRHYNDKVIKQTTQHKKILVQQKSRHTARFVVEEVI